LSRAAAAALLIICTLTACSDDDPADDWTRLGGADASIHTLQEFRGRLVFGGEFTRVDAFGPDEEVHHLAAFADADHRGLDPDVWDDVVQTTDAAGTWYNIDPEPNGNVNAMTIFRGDLIVAGAFSYIGPMPANGVARWDGYEWHALGDGATNGVQGTVYALANDEDQALFVGGNLTDAGGSPVNRIAQWDGATWAPLGAGVNATVYALHARARALFVGGAFSEAGGAPANHIARWSGTAWAPLDVGVDGTVRALTTYRGALIAGGDFVTVNGFEMNHVARWIGAGWLGMGEGVGGSETVTALMVADDLVWAGGTGSTLGDLLKTWNGTNWSSRLDAERSSVNALAAVGSKVLLAVDVEEVGGLLRQ
jgi:hypothetical protein